MLLSGLVCFLTLCAFRVCTHGVLFSVHFHSAILHYLLQYKYVFLAVSSRCA